jgi:homogentisate 1,2-dioxygenase
MMKWGGDLYRTQTAAFTARCRRVARNYYPYKYDRRAFLAVGAISFDTPILDLHGDDVAVETGAPQHRLRDLPGRWAVAENTFRRPGIIATFMSEFMVLVYGVYDAKPKASCRRH